MAEFNIQIRKQEHNKFIGFVAAASSSGESGSNIRSLSVERSQSIMSGYIHLEDPQIDQMINRMNDEKDTVSNQDALHPSSFSPISTGKSNDIGCYTSKLRRYPTAL